MYKQKKMTHRIWFPIVLASIVALTVASVLEAGIWWVLGAGLTAVVALLLYHWSVASPLMAVENGVYLLREQDFSSHLCYTGQPDADRVVELYNTLMDSMKTERLRLQEQHYLLNKLVDASPTGIAICDFDGNITLSNGAFDSLMSQVGVGVVESLEVDESRVVRTDFNQIVRCSCHWFMDSGFRRRFYLIERMTDEIVLAERKMLGRVVRSMGHEVNNTLGSVVSVLDTMAMIHAAEPDVSTTLESCSESCMHLADFVRGYSELVKLPEAEKKPVKLREAIERMMPFLRSLVPSSIELHFKTDENGDKTVAADIMQIERVMVNIVKNAAESVCKRFDGMEYNDGSIEIEVSGGRTVRVTDNGHGITPQIEAGLFTPFFSTKHVDRGLGLMLVTDILRQHSARFSLTTDRATGLTTFSFTL